MKTIIVSTDFSSSSANALDYACAFAKEHQYKILLTHIFPIPATYSGEGVSLATINDALDSNRVKLKDELERAKLHQGLEIEARLITGEFLDSLKALNKELDVAMIIIGAIGEYENLFLWDSNWLDALVSVECPVLVIPQHIRYAPIKNIAFACDYKKLCLPDQIDAIKKLLQLTSAQLHIVHVTSNTIIKNETSSSFRTSFEEVSPTYHFIENKYVITGIADFIKQYHIDLLLVAPHKHGLWYNLFNKSYTKQLALLNHIPIMAIHEQ
jgi:nucleotide-binding universal stress UspA family protein